MFSLSLTVVQRNECSFILLNLGSASLVARRRIDGAADVSLGTWTPRAGDSATAPHPTAARLCKTAGSVHKAANAARCTQSGFHVVQYIRPSLPRHDVR